MKAQRAKRKTSWIEECPSGPISIIRGGWAFVVAPLASQKPKCKPRCLNEREYLKASKKPNE
jgi:hypothetical protein